MKIFKMLLMSAFTILSVSSFAQDSTVRSTKQAKQKSQKTIYSCPMHADVVSDKPGKCSKCGMALVASKKEKMKTEVMKTYACPMHADITSNKPGKCSKCNMDLVQKTPAPGGHQH